MDDPFDQDDLSYAEIGERFYCWEYGPEKFDLSDDPDVTTALLAATLGKLFSIDSMLEDYMEHQHHGRRVWDAYRNWLNSKVDPPA